MQLTSKVTPEFIERLVDKVTVGFKGDVGVVPRQFLRQFLNVLDLTNDYDDYNPMQVEALSQPNLLRMSSAFERANPLTILNRKTRKVTPSLSSKPAL